MTRDPALPHNRQSVTHCQIAPAGTGEKRIGDDHDAALLPRRARRSLAQRRRDGIASALTKPLWLSTLGGSSAPALWYVAECIDDTMAALILILASMLPLISLGASSRHI